ncbi:MAG TPA: N-acetyl-gamma-glutamyl-phosphate reductase [Chitinophagaceae bacterium]|nr:N-acetyl-gamma-glutamyl-phosphate reductase [Chitinophagaceae bacterium]
MATSAIQESAGAKTAIRVGIVGGAGYTGGELIRLLLRHPYVTISFVHSRSHTGDRVASVHQDLVGETDLIFGKELSPDIDALFLCVGHGESRQFFEEFNPNAAIRVIDLSQDFRLRETNQVDDRVFVYGLPELNRDAIRAARNVANPGCFASAIELALLPLARAGLLREVYTTGITGSTGAGQSLTATSHFSWRSNNIQAYKTLDHQHMGEILQALVQLQPAGDIGLSFIPWRGDFTRGIFTSSQLNCELSLEEALQLYNDYYASHPFVFVERSAIFLKQAINTNKCLIQLEKVDRRLVVHSALDNLLKGASGQAVQNMNLMFGFDESAGLHLKASYF